MTGDRKGMSPMNTPPPHSAPLPAEEVHAGRRLTEALVQAAAEHAREHGASIPAARRDAVIVGALVLALGAVSAAIARAHRFDLAEYEEFLTGYVARVFQSESARPVYHGVSRCRPCRGGTFGCTPVRRPTPPNGENGASRE